MTRFDPVEQAYRHPDRYITGYPEILLDDDLALMTPADLERLPEYSCSTPTGVIPGKVWKRALRTPMQMAKHPEWLLGSYEDHDPPDERLVTQRFRKIEVVV